MPDVELNTERDLSNGGQERCANVARPVSSNAENARGSGLFPVPLRHRLYVTPTTRQQGLLSYNPAVSNPRPSQGASHATDARS